MELIKTSVTVAGKEIFIESGKLAKQANGACVIRVGDTMVLVTAVATSTPKEGTDFMPLTVDYKERAYSAGRFPGGFFKREAKPKESEILTSRLIDRSIRPLFSEFYRNDTQVVAMVISHDGENPADIISIIGASVALHLSNIPLQKDIASVRIGRINSKFIVNPTLSQIPQCDLNLVVSGTEEALTMVESGSCELSEQEMLEALNLAKEEISKICKFIKNLPTKEKLAVVEPVIDANLKVEIEMDTLPKAQECVTIKDKSTREVSWATFKADMQTKFAQKYPEQSAIIDFIMEDVFYKEARKILEQMVEH